MAIDKMEQATELLKFLKLDSAESVEDAKEKFQQDWVKSDEVAARIGKVTGSIINVARKAWEPFGVVLTEEDFKAKKVEDVFRDASERAKVELDKKEADWKQRITAGGSEELLKDMEKKYKALERKNDESDNARKDVMSQFDTYKKEVAEHNKKVQIDTTFEKELSKIQLDESANEFTVKGFKSTISELYDIDVEETGEVVVRDRSTKERINSKQKAGDFVGLNELLLMEATKANILKKSPHVNARIPFGGSRQPAATVETAESLKRSRVNPNFFGTRS